ncbi:MAG: type II toxin-antitoxin system VapC family toxin [Planctomycetes bacterium]|nr:type II toxin-antitoxin system VapC family toxin [Planctomycetota bacterium]
MTYLDTSVLAAYYCPEKLSNSVEKALHKVRQPTISQLVELELCSALAIKIRTGQFDAPSAGIVLGRFRVHVADGRYRFVEIASREYDIARDWLARFDTLLRAPDALHLAAAFANGLELLTADHGLAESAGRLGVKCKLINA